MATPEIIAGQRDFSAGEVDQELKRADDLPIQRAGARQMRDWLAHASRTLEQRPGRRVKYLQGGRIDRIRVAAGVFYDLAFSNGSIGVNDLLGVNRAFAAGFTWTNATTHLIVWSQVKIDTDTTDIVVTFSGMRPLTLRYTRSTDTWVISGFAFAIGGDNIALVPYYRVAAPGATMIVSASGGPGAAVNVAFSAPVLLPTHVGTLFRWANRRLAITTYLNALAGTATLLEEMLPTQVLNLAALDGGALIGTLGFALGQVVRGSESECEGEVVGINSGTNQITVQVTNNASGFVASAVGPPEVNEIIVGPNGRAKCTIVTTVGPAPCVTWDEQAISDARGWPRSCSSDQQRLIFCDLPGVPHAVIWSATNQPYNFGVGPNATDAIMEPIAGSPRVFHVMPWSDEIVFTDDGIFYVPINQTNPLKPGSVSFPKTAPDACSEVRPAFTSDGYLFVNAGKAGVSALVASGAAFSAQPYRIQDITQYHSHLFEGVPKALAVAIGGGKIPERHVFVVNEDSKVVVGQFEAGKQWVGWMPWSGVVNYVSCYQATVLFIAAYEGAYVYEEQDTTCYLDGALLVNAMPTAMTPPAGRGPFWWRPSSTIQLMDGTKPMGARAVDHLGVIQPAFPGEDLTSLTLMGGAQFTPTIEPFFPNAQPGQANEQRIRQRSVNHMVVTVEGCAGITLAQLFAGPERVGAPAPGTVVYQRVIPPWMPADNPTVAPPLRDATYRQRFFGRDFDPRHAVIKHVPGPVKLIEVGLKGTV